MVWLWALSIARNVFAPPNSVASAGVTAQKFVQRIFAAIEPFPVMFLLIGSSCHAAASWSFW